MTTTPQTPWRTMLGTAYVLGPLITLASALAVLVGGRNPEPMDFGSATEGLIGIVGFALLVPVFMHLAGRLHPVGPRLAKVTVVTALLGFAAGGVYQMAMRVVIRIFADAGVDQSVMQTIADDAEAGTTTTLLAAGLGPLIPLTSIAIGVGYVRGRSDVRLGWMLTVAGILFLAGQALVVATEVTYTAALVLWSLALVPIGLDLRSGPTTVDIGARTSVVH